jgi:acyl-CoA synthetase (AMP-forming)/AMP-acid ligase II
LTPEADEAEEDIISYLQSEGVDKGKITQWMLPVYVAIVDGIPKTSVGKYDKIEVRRRLEEFLAKAKRVR